MVSREADVQTELERNPNYFREGLPYFDGMRADWNAWDPAYRAAQYVAGASDILFTPWLGYPAENAAVRDQVGEENVVEVPMNGAWNWVAVALPHHGRALHRPARAPGPASRHRPGTTLRGDPR